MLDVCYLVLLAWSHDVPVKTWKILCMHTPKVDGCELPRGSWELNLGPLQKQQVLLTTELSLGPFVSLFKLHKVWEYSTHSIDEKLRVREVHLLAQSLSSWAQLWVTALYVP